MNPLDSIYASAKVKKEGSHALHNTIFLSFAEDGALGACGACLAPTEAERRLNPLGSIYASEKVKKEGPHALHENPLF